MLDWLLHSAARPSSTITSVGAAVEDVFSGVCRSILAEFVLVSLLGWSQQGGWSSKAANKAAVAAQQRGLGREATQAAQACVSGGSGDSGGAALRLHAICAP